MAAQSGGDQGTIEADVVVLGAGSAGETVAAICARGGLRVVAVESGMVGGQCPYHACIPSKSLLLSAVQGLGWSEAVRRRDEHARHQQDQVAAGQLRAAGVVLLRGRGEVSGPGLLTVEPHRVEVRFEDLVVTTGSVPIVPDLPGLAAAPMWTSDQALVASELPPRVMILGGGPTGCELAQAYARFGSEVTLVESGLRLLPSEPDFVGDLLGRVLTNDGVRIRLGVQPEWVERPRAGGSRTTTSAVLVGLSGGSVVATDRVLVAVGRRPNLAGIGLERLGPGAEAGPDGGAGAGLGIDDRGRVGPGVWAAGDVTGVAPFTHTATHTARVVADNLLGRPHRLDLSAVPRAVYTDPAALGVGITPAQAEHVGKPLLQKGFNIDGTARAYLEGWGEGRVAVNPDPADGRLLGAAAVAPRADDLMGQAVLAVRIGLDVQAWADTIQPFPALSEAFGPPLRELAAEAGAGGAAGRVSLAD
jgi:dihydrolipoamide dehydrogenase